MKKQIFFLSMLACLASCSQEGDTRQTEDTTARNLVLVPSINPATRAGTDFTSNDYFNTAGYQRADVEAVTVAGTQSGTFFYTEGVFSAETQQDNINFPKDGSNISSITFKWPQESKREIIYDQRTLRNFKVSDWLIGKTTDVEPEQYVTLNMDHENNLVVFSLTVASTPRKITRLTYGLFSAYCDEDSSVREAKLHVNNAWNVFSTDIYGTVMFEGSETPELFRVHQVPSISAQYNQRHQIQIKL